MPLSYTMFPGTALTSMNMMGILQPLQGLAYDLAQRTSTDQTLTHPG